MISSQTQKITATVLMLAAAAAPCSGFSQPVFERDASEEQRELIERIQEEQAQDGMRSPGLIDPLTALSRFYQENGDHGAAAAAIGRARLIVRVNYGLYSLEEAPLIRRLIDTEEARGDVEAAWDLEQKLLRLVKRHPKDLRTVPILLEISGKRMDVLQRYKAGEFPPQIVLGCYYKADIGSCRAGSRGVVVGAIWSEARAYYLDAYAVVRRNQYLAANGALACESPRSSDVAFEEELSEREARPVSGDIHRYLREMSDYVGCMQAQYEAAERIPGVPASLLPQLASENAAAVAELEHVKAVYEDRIGPVPINR